MPGQVEECVVEGDRIDWGCGRTIGLPQRPPDEPLRAVPLRFTHVLNELHLVLLVLEAPHARPRDARKHRVDRCVRRLHRQVNRIPARPQVERLDRVGITTHRQLTQLLQHHHQRRGTRHLARRILHHAVVLSHSFRGHLGVRHHQRVRRLSTHRRRRGWAVHHLPVLKRHVSRRSSLRDGPIPVVPPVCRRIVTRSIPLHHHPQRHTGANQHIHIARLLRDHWRFHQTHRRRFRRHRSIATRRHRHRVVAHILQPNACHAVRQRRRSRYRIAIQGPLITHITRWHSSRGVGRHAQRQ